MRQRRSYDRGYHRYGRDYDTPRRYEEDFGRYGTPLPGAHGYPSARWGWGPIGWAAYDPGMPFIPALGASPDDYGFSGRYRTPRRRPEESPSFGRGGDRALRRWTDRQGYDTAYTIQPRRNR